MQLSYINISETLASYLQQIKNDSIIAELLLIGNIPQSKLVENHIDFLSLSNEDPFKISYLTPERVTKIEQKGEDLWNSSSRYHTKYGSFVNKLFNCFENKDVEKFSNLLRSVVDKKEFNIKVVSGYEIPKWYGHQTYAEQCGTLGQSCMKHEACRNFFELYAQNPENISMLIFTDSDNLLIGRALLWQFDTYKIMDRIYTINDEKWSYYFKQWANKNGFSYKEKQNWNWTLQFEANGKRLKQRLSFKLKHFTDLEYYPYLDTFKWFDRKTGEIFNYKPDDDSNIRIMMHPDGSLNRSAEALQLDDYTDAYEHRDYLKRLDYRSTEKEFRTGENNLFWSDINDMWILKDDGKYSEELGDYIFTEKWSEFNDNEKVNLRLEKMRNRNALIKEELDKLENGVVETTDIMRVFDTSYRGIYDRADIRSIIEHYNQQRQREIQRETERQAQVQAQVTATPLGVSNNWIQSAIDSLGSTEAGYYDDYRDEPAGYTEPWNAPQYDEPTPEDEPSEI